MEDDLEKIMHNSSFSIIEGTFLYVKAKRYPDQPDKHFMISSDADEITVVTRQENLTDLNVIERNKDNYSLIALNVAVPFYSVGFLATVSKAIAKAGMNILIISTYSKDYILVKADQSDQAKEELLKLGFQEKLSR